MQTGAIESIEDARTPSDWAEDYRVEIEKCLEANFSVSSDELKLLLKEDGVYWSKEEPDTLCCLVVGKKNGFLYLVTGEVGADRKNLQNFKCSIVA